MKLSKEVRIKMVQIRRQGVDLGELESVFDELKSVYPQADLVRTLKKIPNLPASLRKYVHGKARQVVEQFHQEARLSDGGLDVDTCVRGAEFAKEMSFAEEASEFYTRLIESWENAGNYHDAADFAFEDGMLQRGIQSYQKGIRKLTDAFVKEAGSLRSEKTLKRLEGIYFHLEQLKRELFRTREDDSRSSRRVK